MTLIVECADGAERERAISAGRAAARRGDLVVVPTESVYAIATDAFSSRGLAAMRAAKGYPVDHPLPVMVPSRTTVPGIALRVSDDATALMRAFWPGPLTLLLDPQPSLAWDQPATAPLAVRMPLHPLLLALLVSTGPMVVTAAGMPGMPDPVTAIAALAMAGADASVVLDAGELGAGVTDGVVERSSVVDARQSPVTLVREGSVTLDRIREACPGVVG